MNFPNPSQGSGLRPATPAAAPISTTNKQAELPKCFGTDYFGKWNMTGMTFESMKIDRPEYQQRCAYCQFFDRCYFCNHIRLLRIKH